jgi:hypothetical protein
MLVVEKAHKKFFADPPHKNFAQICGRRIAGDCAIVEIL